MTNPIIGYHSLLDTGVVTVNTENGDNVKENCYDWRLDDYWQPDAATNHKIEIDMTTAQSADYVAFYSSDLESMAGAQVIVYSGSSYPATTHRVTIAVAGNGKIFLGSFVSASARYWRIYIETTAVQAPKFQMVTLGDRLDLERCLSPGFSPPNLGSQNKITTNISEKGIFLGRSLEVEPIKFNMRLELITDTWLRANWPALLAHIERYPFFVQTLPDVPDTVMAWTDKIIKTPLYSHPVHLSIDLRLKAFI